MSSRSGSPDLSDTLAAEQSIREAERCREREEFKSGTSYKSFSERVKLTSQILVEIRTSKKVLPFLSIAVLSLRSATEHYLSAIVNIFRLLGRQPHGHNIKTCRRIESLI